MNRKRRSPRMEKFKRCFIVMIFATLFFITYVVLFVRENYEIIQKMAEVYREERDKLRIQVFRVQADWSYLAWGKGASNQTKSRNQTSHRFPNASDSSLTRRMENLRLMPVFSNQDGTQKGPKDIDKRYMQTDAQGTKNINQSNVRFLNAFDSNFELYQRKKKKKSVHVFSNKTKDTLKEHLVFDDKSNMHPDHASDHHVQEDKPKSVGGGHDGGRSHGRGRNRGYSQDHYRGHRPAGRPPAGSIVEQSKHEYQLDGRHSLKEALARRSVNRKKD